MNFSDKRFEKYVKIMPSGCWEWQGSKNSGYGRVKRRKLFGRNDIGAHRYAFYLVHGYIPELNVCHKCDNPPCVNPDHFFLGTDKDNSDDKRMKGRSKVGSASVPGENNGNAKLTASAVEGIRSLLNLMNNKQLAARYEVHHSTISAIRRGKNWKIMDS